MYTSLHIKGFRCFRDFKMEKLARINLIGGKNNTGKTALLEGVALRAALPEAPSMLMLLYDARALNFREVGRHLGFADLFTAGLDQPVAELTTSETSGEPTTVTLTGIPANEIEVPVDQGSPPPPPGAPMAGLQGVTPLNLRFSLLDAEGRQLEGTAEWRSDGISLRAPTKQPHLADTSFVVTRTLGIHSNLVALFGRLQVKREEERVTRALRPIEPGLRAINTVVVGDTPVLYADVGEPTLRPLGLLGEGLHRLCLIVVALCAVPGGRVLVDEIDNGLHYSVLPDVWRAVAQAAVELDVQVFATTHSHECVEAAHEAAADMPEGTFLYHRLDRVEDEIECHTYSNRGLDIAIQTGNEVR